MQWLTGRRYGEEGALCAGGAEATLTHDKFIHALVELPYPLLHDPGAAFIAFTARNQQKEQRMASSGSGTIRPLYGVIIRDKCKSADLDTLKAYKIVGHDLLKSHSGADADDLKEALKDLDKAIAKHK